MYQYLAYMCTSMSKGYTVSILEISIEVKIKENEVFCWKWDF